MSHLKPRDYLAKHKKLITKYAMSLSTARDYLFSSNINKIKYRSPAVLTNCFLLRYYGAQLRTRIKYGAIAVDKINYSVIYSDCTPTDLNSNTDEFWASFRRFHDDFELPAVVIIYPCKRPRASNLLADVTLESIDHEPI